MIKYLKKVNASNGLKYYFGTMGTMIVHPDSKELKTFAKACGYDYIHAAKYDMMKYVFILALIDDPTKKLDIIEVQVD